MTTTDLKGIWRKANDAIGQDQESREEIQKMIDGRTSGQIKKIRNKLIIEVLLYAVVTYAFVEMFDALEKGIAIVSFAGILILMGIVNNLMFYRFLKISIHNEDLTSFLEKTIRRLKREMVFRMVFFTVFITSMLLILMPDPSRVMSSKGGIAFLAVALLSLAVKLIFENQVWKEHIGNLEQSLAQLRGE